MNCENYQKLIQEYHDRELAKGTEPMVFAHLSSCNECREFFSALNLLEEAVKEEIETFPQKLEERIFNSIRYENKRGITGILNKKVPAYIAYAVTIILIFITLYMFNTTNEYKEDLREAINLVKEQNKIVDEQNKQIQMIFNSFPEINVTYKLKNEVVVSAKL